MKSEIHQKSVLMIFLKREKNGEPVPCGTHVSRRRKAHQVFISRMYRGRAMRLNLLSRGVYILLASVIVCLHRSVKQLVVVGKVSKRCATHLGTQRGNFLCLYTFLLFFHPPSFPGQIKAIELLLVPRFPCLSADDGG